MSFFFSSRRRHTRFDCDWSSDVCSSDLTTPRFMSHYQYFDGRGAPTQTYDNYSSANGWSTQDIEYDSMGRAYRTSDPYYSSGYNGNGINTSGPWTTQTFDNLGRVRRVDMPS